MQLSSIIPKIEYDFVPVWIAQVVPMRTPLYIARHFSTSKTSILYSHLLVLSRLINYMLLSLSLNLHLGIWKQI